MRRCILPKPDNSQQHRFFTIPTRSYKQRKIVFAVVKPPSARMFLSQPYNSPRHQLLEQPCFEIALNCLPSDTEYT
jgi:hypothetical protein